MEQAKARNALEPFLALAPSARTPTAAAQVITQATSAPNTFTFTPLLQSTTIRALADSPEHASYHTLLQIFSYGTYETYTSTAGLPKLNDAQRLKLRQLSLLTLARSRSNLSYETLQTALSLETSRELEETAITAIYAGLLNATIDPTRQTIQISSVSPLRDLSPGSVPELINALKTWSGSCTSTLEDLEAQMQNIRAEAVRREKRVKLNEDKLKAAITSANEASEGATRDGLPRRAHGKRPMAPGSDSHAGADDMEVDAPSHSIVGDLLKRAGKRKM